jgi:outer membrane receptor protein involved in Fe transport
VAISLYHKEFERPIISTVRANGSSDVLSWANVDSGTISGIELEIRKTLWERLVIGGNFSYIESEIDPIEGGLGSATVFEGQPEYILNFNVGYADEARGFSANLFYNYVDDTLRFVGQNVPSVFEKGRTSLDFNISQVIAGIRFRFSIKNLMDEATEFYYEAPESPVYERFKRGRSMSLSASYTF